jgi:transposase
VRSRKTGNSHLRRAVGEAAWRYHRPRLNQRQKQSQGELAPKVAEIAWAAQERLHRRYWALSNTSKPSTRRPPSVPMRRFAAEAS